MSFFNAPSAPPMPALPPSPPPLPTIQKAQDDIRQDEALRRRRPGRSGSLLTGETGDTSATPVGQKSLLGQ